MNTKQIQIQHWLNEASQRLSEAEDALTLAKAAFDKATTVNLDPMGDDNAKSL